MTLNADTYPVAMARFLWRLQWGIAAAFGLWVLSLLAPILTPFVASMMLAWLGDPLVDRLEGVGYSRNTSVILVFLLMSLLLALGLLFLVPMIQRQITTLIGVLPQIQHWLLEVALPWIEQKTDVELDAWLEAGYLFDWLSNHWRQASGAATTVVGYVSRSGMAVLTWIINLVLTPILTYYFLRDWDRLVSHIATLIPRTYIHTVAQLARQSNDVLSGFVRGQIAVMISLGIIYAVGLSVAGLNLGLLIGLIAGLISFIPYLGATTGIVMAVVAALIQAHGFDWKLLSFLAVVFTIGQLLESYVLTPRFVGDRIGLHPVAVIFAVMAGGQLFGFLGMLLALPTAAVINVLLHYVNERYQQSELYSGHAHTPADSAAVS